MQAYLKMFTVAALVSASAAHAERKSSPADGTKIVCKSERFVGSHISSRICKTRDEWAAGTERDRRWLEKNGGKLFFDPPKADGGGAHIGPTNGGGPNIPGS